MPGRATKAPAAPTKDEVEVNTDTGAEEANGTNDRPPTPEAAAKPNPTGQGRVMTRAATRQDLEDRLESTEAQCAVATASRDLYKSAFNLSTSSLLAALKGGLDIEDMAKGLQAESMEQAVKNSSKVLKMDGLHGCALTGRDLAAKITQVCGLVPKILDSMSAENVVEVKSLIVPLIKGPAKWENVNSSVYENCRRDERGVPGLYDLVDALCAGAGAKADENKFFKVAAVTVVAVLLSS